MSGHEGENRRAEGFGAAEKAIACATPFTLNELLAVLFATLLLASLMAPTLIEIRALSKQAACVDNLMAIGKANLLYLSDNGRYVPASPGGPLRWHGALREEPEKPPEFSKSPLRPYLKGFGAIRSCPFFERIADESRPAPEKGGGGYGYNENIGSLRAVQREFDLWDPRCKALGVKSAELLKPRGAVMFAESASKANERGELDVSGRLVEAAFCKSYDFYNRGKPVWGTPEPSIHFRHGGMANVAWCDGHISAESPGGGKGGWSKDGIGFIGSRSNSGFVPRTPPAPEEGAASGEGEGG